MLLQSKVKMECVSLPCSSVLSVSDIKAEYMLTPLSSQSLNFSRCSSDEQSGL